MPCFCLIFDFYDLVHTFDSMIGDDRSLFTLFRFEHREVEPWRSPSTSVDIEIRMLYKLILKYLYMTDRNGFNNINVLIEIRI